MEITTFLAQLWGPVVLAVGVGVFVSRAFYIRVYREIERNTLAVLLFGMIAMAVGIVHISVHNIWGTPLEVIISLLGWVLCVKGILFIVVPNFVDRMGDGWVNRKLIPWAGVMMLLLGGYLTWSAYIV